MKKREIKNGDIFIIFDMEWNQPIGGMDYGIEVSELTGEIIEIGAVRAVYRDGKLRIVGVFSCDIRPKIYRKMHYHVKKVTRKTSKDLMNGIDFTEAYGKFRKFCGDDFILCGWGNSDPSMLRQNLKFFGSDPDLRTAFLDIQPIFSLFSGERGSQKSVEFAVDYYDIAKVEDFHGATADAKYTAEILRKIFAKNDTQKVLGAITGSLTDPDIKSEFTAVGPEADTPDLAIEALMPVIGKCPVCDSEVHKVIEGFRIRKSYYAMMNCDEHGDIYCRIRSKKHKSGKCFGACVMRLSTQNDRFILEQKAEEYLKYGPDGSPPEPKSDKNTEKK